MQITQAPTTSILPYPQNNRTHPDQQIERIATSIKEYGFNQPIVIDEKNEILVGHGRFLAAQKLKLASVPVLKKTNLNETQKRAYRILDNKLQNDSAWEFENLEAELNFLEENDFDLEAWGLDSLKGLFEEVIPHEFDESISDGVIQTASILIKIPIEDLNNFEQQLDDILKKFPNIKKEKKV